MTDCSVTKPRMFSGSWPASTWASFGCQVLKTVVGLGIGLEEMGCTDAAC